MFGVMHKIEFDGTSIQSARASATDATTRTLLKRQRLTCYHYNFLAPTGLDHTVFAFGMLIERGARRKILCQHIS